jgi:CO/xanthine dehydrogenase Mo-binding subunit
VHRFSCLSYVRAERQEKSDKQTNVASQVRFARGDLEAGFKAADVVVEREFNTAMVHQGYIEPHNAVAQYNPDGQTTIWTSTQGAFTARDQCALVLNIPASSIKVIPAEIGGGFGGKIGIYLEPLALLMSKKTGKPVKLVMSRGEVLRATGPTSGSHIRVKMGANKKGEITAAQIWMAYEAGAFPGSPVGAGCMTVLAPYNLEKPADRRLRRGGQPT